MGNSNCACLQTQSDQSLDREKSAEDISTNDLVMTARPDGVLELAEQSLEFRQHLEKFAGTEPLDQVYVSLHTYWLHSSNIPVRALRIQRDAQGVQSFLMDDVPGGTWEFRQPVWLGISRAPGQTRWYEAVPGTKGWVHRSDDGAEPEWQVTLMPLVDEAQGQELRPLP